MEEEVTRLEEMGHEYVGTSGRSTGRLCTGSIHQARPIEKTVLLPQAPGIPYALVDFPPCRAREKEVAMRIQVAESLTACVTGLLTKPMLHVKANVAVIVIIFW
ncbi:uncharacterized protein EV420DRAFT_1478194 [Desarmillaria tabescens]|uniref:Uncharacterized protein n=1 Tax=Armillaria tabescens TaxID=1929756 RepID=A0AA39N6W0_ARMTA|nr:uncharacterized protein EV420DRAFT_1478194 [Desarmillaria tabescens]KAK0460411.1 hypothetical protein EV420DRAFT_1478194 [Desarmillaria tabescens]